MLNRLPNLRIYHQTISAGLLLSLAACTWTMRLPAHFDPQSGYLVVEHNYVNSDESEIRIGDTQIDNYREDQDFTELGLNDSQGIGFDITHHDRKYTVRCYMPEIFLRACTMYDQQGHEFAEFLDVQNSVSILWDRPGRLTIGERNYIVHLTDLMEGGTSRNSTVGRFFGRPALTAVDCGRDIVRQHRYWEVSDLDETTKIVFRAFAAFISMTNCEPYTPYRAGPRETGDIILVPQ